MLRSLIFVVVFLSAGFPTSSGAHEATPGVDSGDLRIAEQQVVDIPDAEPLALSPDGRWLAVWSGAGEEPAICAYDAATLTEDRCATVPRSSIQADSVVWSPDGTRVAFTESALRELRESDIWVADFATGTATDLTDDGVEKIIGAPLGTPLDLAPAWSPDGTEIVFSRSVKTGEDADGEDIAQTALYRISAVGGEPSEIAKVADSRYAVPAGVRWLADGTILYSVDMASDDPANGVWTVAVEGGEPRQIVSADEADAGATIVVDVSTEGWVLVLDPGRGFLLLDPTTGQSQSLTLSVVDDRPIVAAFSPDGARLLIATARQLVVHDLATGAQQVVGTIDQPIGAADYRSGLAWAANNLVFGPSAARTGVLVRLATA